MIKVMGINPFGKAAEKGKAFTIVFICIVMILSGCKGRKSYKQMFDETFEINVQACIEPLVKLGTEPAEARRICECMLNTMFEIDSTYQFMEPDKAHQLFQLHEDEILKCIDPDDFYIEEVFLKEE